MATKPNIALARFADAAGADVAPPPSVLRDSGFVDDTPIEQGFVNELFRQNYLWAKYLSEGALSGDHSVAGNVSVTGNQSVTGSQSVGGNLSVAGNVLGDLSVIGGLSAGGTLSGSKLRLATSGKTIDHVAPSGMAASYALTWPAALPSTPRYLAVDQSGNIIAGRSVPLYVPGGQFTLKNGDGASKSGFVWSVNPLSGAELVCDLSVLGMFPGMRVTSLVWSVSASINTGLQFRMRKRSFGDNGAVVGDAISDSFTTTSAGAQARESVRSSPYLVEQNMMYELSIQFNIGNHVFDGARLILDGL